MPLRGDRRTERPHPEYRFQRAIPCLYVDWMEIRAARTEPNINYYDAMFSEAR
jgi:hypothetical protein